MNSDMTFGGALGAKVSRAAGPGWGWKARNMLRWSFVWGVITTLLARLFSKITGIPTILGQLEARLVRSDGRVIDFGVVSRRVVTDAGVGYLVDAWDAGTVIAFNFHASGTGTTAEAAGQTALTTEAAAITDRATGTKSQPAANQLQSQATQNFTGAGAITEHGLFSVVTESSGVLWDRSQFAALNVANGDSIQWTYTCTLNSGG